MLTIRLQASNGWDNCNFAASGMYGLVNRAIQQMVTTSYGEETWQQIKDKAELSRVDFFETYESYPDDVTHRLVASASETLCLSTSEIMKAFGEYWITYTANEGYELLLEHTGGNLPEFLDHLDNLHARAGLSFPNLQPPSFRCVHMDQSRIDLHYESRRRGFAPMVIGLLQGLGRRFRTPVSVKQTASRDQGDGGDRFLIQHGDAVVTEEPG